jgi:hypothetical protein
MRVAKSATAQDKAVFALWMSCAVPKIAGVSNNRQTSVDWLDVLGGALIMP